MADMRIDQFVVPGATDELQEALRLMKELAKEITDLNSKMKGGESMLGQARGISEITAMQKALAEQNAQLVESFAKLTKAVAIYQERSSRRKGPEDDAAKAKKKEDAEFKKMLAEEERDNKRREAARKKQLMEEYKDRQKAAADRKKEIADAKKDFDDYQKFVTASTEKARKAKEAADKKASQDAKKLEADQKKLAAEMARDAKIAEDAANDYLQLSKAYNEAALRAKNLQINLGASHPIARQATKDAAELGQQLKNLDASVGQYGRNVGNYDGATKNLRGSLTQIARELPSLSNGFQTFASAIGNNIAPAQEAIQNFRAEQKALAAEGKATKSIWTELGRSILSWQTLLLVGVTLLTTYSKEIAEFTKNIFGAGNAIGKAEAELQVFNEAIEDSKVKEIADELDDMAYYVKLATEGIVKGNDVIEIWNDGLGKVLGSATSLEEIQEKLIAQGPKLLEMRFKQALVDAAAAKEIDAILKQRQLEHEQAVAPAPLTAKEQTGVGAWESIKTGGVFGTIWDMYEDYTRKKGIEAEKTNKETWAGIKESMQKDLADFLRDNPGLNFLGDQLDDKKDKKKKGRQPEDLFNEQMKAQEKFLEQRELALAETAEREAQTQLAIAENENLRFEDRLAAYGKYISARAEQTKHASEAEIDVVQFRLDKIRELEAIPEKQRTKEQNDLVRQKEALNAELVTLQLKANNDMLKAVQDGFNLIDAATEKFNKDQAQALKSRLDLARDLFNAWQKQLDDDLKKEKKAWDARMKMLDDYVDAAMSVFSIMSSVTQGASDRRIQEIEREKNALNERLEVELANIEASALSEEDKQRRLIEARKEAAAEQKVLDNQRAQEAKRNAVFQKALALTTVGILTAQAVMKALSDPTLLGPAAAAQAIAAGAAGLAQAAAILAQPIPEYFVGTGDEPHPGGPARLFEGNLPEAVFEPGKKPWIGDKEGIYSLLPGTEVVSNADLLQAAGPYALGLGPDGQKKTAAQDSGFREGFDRVAKAIENKPVGSISITGQGIRHFVEAGSSLIEYERNLIR